MAGRGFDFFKTSSIGRGRGLNLQLRLNVPRELNPPQVPPRTGLVATASRLAEPENTQEERPLAVYKTRPGTAEENKEGTSGREVALSANYFRLTQTPTFEFSLYRVDFEPHIDHAGLRRAFVAQHKEHFGGYLFDGQFQLYLTRRLPEDEMNFVCTSREGLEYVLLVKKTPRVIKMTDAMATHIFNLILRRTMEGLNMQLVGRNLYDAKNKVLLSQFQLELWPGYITSVRQHEHNILVCCEVSHKVMRQETIYEILRNCKQLDERNWQDNFKREILGSIVLTGYNNKTYRVDDVDFNSTPSSTFKKKDREVSYKDYYEEKYKIIIRDPAQPMLVSKPKARDVRAGLNQVLFLVPELCRATGLTEKMRSNFTMMKAMDGHTRMDPENRRKRLLDFTKRLHSTKECYEKLKAFNTDIENDLIAFKGRELNQEIMYFGNGKTVPNDDRVDWTNPMKMNQMFTTVALKRWVFIYPKKFSSQSEEFLKLMVEVANGMKYEMTDPKKIEMPDDRVLTYTQQIEEVMQKDPNLIMIVVPNNAGDRYAAIKRLTCVNRAIPTQIIISKTMMPKKEGNIAGVKSIATKVIVQLNSKLGGAPWMIKFPIKGMMTIGFDVTHNTKDRSKSYGAFVATMDLNVCPKYFSAVSAHQNGEEMSSNIELHVIKAMKAYREQHGTLPERIFFYRDGVGDGQIEYVHSQEVTKLAMKLREIYSNVGDGSLAPKFSFIIVNKRLNTRIFKGTNSVKNPNSGTVVDNTITLPERYDFYLVSQSVRQGTVAPTSYNVIHDTNGLKPDQMQMMTYKQTHLYYNWSGTTRVPAVVQYAHKLALLVGDSLHNLPSEAFSNQLYFL